MPSYITGDIDKSLLYFVYETIDDYKVAVNDHRTIILDASNNKVAELNIVGIAYLTGNKLYSIHEKSIRPLRENRFLKKDLSLLHVLQ